MNSQCSQLEKQAFGLVPAAAGNTGVQMAGWFNREINSLDDMKGKVFGFGDPNSTSGYLIPSIIQERIIVQIAYSSGTVWSVRI